MASVLTKIQTRFLNDTWVEVGQNLLFDGCICEVTAISEDDDAVTVTLREKVIAPADSVQGGVKGVFDVAAVAHYGRTLTLKYATGEVNKVYVEQ